MRFRVVQGDEPLGLDYSGRDRLLGAGSA